MAWALRQQAIIWANGAQIYAANMASLGHNELTHWPLGDVAVFLNG